jgi:hypothetical protein
MATPKKPADEEFFEEHFPYEIAMLSNAHTLISVKGAELNTAIESFAIHARAFFEFFEVKKKQGYCASDFTVSKYVPQFVDKIDQKTIDKLNQQIAHMTGKRTSKQEDKFGGKEQAEVLEAINKEIAEFKKHLKPQFSAAAGMVQAPTTASATNVVTIVSSP